MTELKNTNQQKVGYAVVGWNNKTILAECFESIQAQTVKDKVTIYWDNNSSDDSVAFVRKQFPWVKVIESPENIGFAAANNRIIEEFTTDKAVTYIALVNSDARLAPDWTETLLATATYKPNVALLQGKTFDYYNHSIIDSTHIYVSRSGQATQGGWRKVDIGADSPMHVYGVNAAACLVSVRFITEQPEKTLFDESFFMYLEDVDVSMRALMLGWDAYFVPNAKAYHMGSASSGKNPGFSIYMTYRNNFPMLVKNVPTRHLLKMIVPMIRSDKSTVKRLSSLGQGVAARKLLKGRIYGLLRSPLYLPKRYQLYRARAVNVSYVWEMMKKGRLN